MSHLYISAAHKSSGKTMIITGIARALSERGLSVQPFKKGPDYIDPKWLSSASHKVCYNLDYNTQNEDELKSLFAYYDNQADISLIEGNKGLHDGVDLEGSNSNSALAKLLNAPVVLVINTMGTTRGIAPLLLGYQQFDPDVNIQGVILNMVQGQRHEDKLINAVEHYTDIPVLGAVRRNPNLVVDERHLGLVPYNEYPTASARIETITQQIIEQVDIDRIKAIADVAIKPSAPVHVPATFDGRPDVRIAVAKDSAFGFYYPDDLEALQRAGARIVYFNALNDVYLPTCDALYIGGGFPETHMAKLEANKTLRTRIKAALQAGLPAYAECGGLMYLSRTISWHDDKHKMVGVIPADIVMHLSPQGRGHMEISPTKDHPWPGMSDHSDQIYPAHEFHNSNLENIDPDLKYAYDVHRGQGVTGKQDGIVIHNVVAGFAHLRNSASCPWAESFVSFVRTLKTKRGKAPSPAQIAG